MVAVANPVMGTSARGIARSKQIVDDRAAGMTWRVIGMRAEVSIERARQIYAKAMRLAARQAVKRDA
jgi:DNA-directed RNA polymerase sigma subunit (sigma70/sigma32)